MKFPLFESDEFPLASRYCATIKQCVTVAQQVAQEGGGEARGAADLHEAKGKCRHRFSRRMQAIAFVDAQT
jgi:hypothetical protein